MTTVTSAMRQATAAAVVIGALSTVTLKAGAAPDESRAPRTAVAPQGSPAVPNHAVSGVVKSVDATRLVITRAGKTPREMTFVLKPSTEREGPIGVGATVQVRFLMQGRTQVATAILATRTKEHAAMTPEHRDNAERACAL